MNIQKYLDSLTEARYLDFLDGKKEIVRNYCEFMDIDEEEFRKQHPYIVKALQEELQDWLRDQ